MFTKKLKMYICVYCLTQTRTITHYMREPSTRQGDAPRQTNPLDYIRNLVMSFRGAQRQDGRTD